jgi:hypothetical protein
MDDHVSDNDGTDECVHAHPVPPEELGRYSVDSDPHSERDIATYVESQAKGETVRHVERIKQEIIIGDTYEMFDVVTDQNRWWVITNLTNLYSQSHFPSLDYTLSFHVGLMMRMRSRPVGAHAEEATPFEEVFRRQEQAKHRFDAAVEAEDYQAVGMQLRECLLSLVAALRRHAQIADDVVRPQEANFMEWSGLLLEHMCGGRSNKPLRKHLRSLADETWQLVSWITHYREANRTAASIAIHSCDTVVGHFVQLLERQRTDWTEKCPICQSRRIRTHFDRFIEPDGDYYTTCGTCAWSSHPGQEDP